MLEVSWSLAFVAGLASFLSPCIVPLVPSYLSALAGTSVSTTQTAVVRGRVIVHALVFILGFTVVLVLSGLLATALGTFVRDHLRLFAELGGLVMILLGLEVLGVIQLGILNRPLQFSQRGSPSTLAGAFVLGLVFAAGWMPCVSPIEGSILILAANSRSVLTGGTLLLVYAMGLALPFLLLAILLDRAISITRKLSPWLPWIARVAGVLLVLLGIALVTGWYQQIPGLL